MNDITGQKFNRLTALFQSDKRNTSKALMWTFECECGTIKNIVPASVISGRTQSCGCLNREIIRSHQTGIKNSRWTGIGEISGKAIAHIKSHARTRNIAYHLTKADLWNQFIKQERRCALTGQLIIFGTCDRLTREGTASLDRISSKKPYIVDNIQWIHKDLNIMKWHFEQEHFIDMCTLVAKYKNKANL